MGIESACIPLPSEIIMPFSGYLVYTGRFNLFWVATAGAIGCNLGSASLTGSAPRAAGRWSSGSAAGCWMSHHDLDRTTRFFEKYGTITVLLGRLLPVVRTFIAFPAGVARCRSFAFMSTRSWVLAVVLRPGLCRHEARARAGKPIRDSRVVSSVSHRCRAGPVVGIVWFLWTHLKRFKARRSSICSPENASGLREYTDASAFVNLFDLFE